jgi:hypothetical protein
MCGGFVQKCGGWDSNPRTPKRQEPQSCAFDQAGRPPLAQQIVGSADLCFWDGAAAGNRTPTKGSTVPYATTTPQRPRKQIDLTDKLKGFRETQRNRYASSSRPLTQATYFPLSVILNMFSLPSLSLEM